MPSEVKFFMLLVVFPIKPNRYILIFKKCIVSETLHYCDNIEEIKYYATVLKLYFVR